MEQYVPILDHGYIKLVETWGSDEAIIEAARMSTNKGFQGWGADAKLLAYLHKHKHSTPFEMAGAVIEVKAPIFVFREWHRHRTQCLSGNTQVIFERPHDGRSYPMRLSDVVKRWNPPGAKRRRKDQSPLSLAEFNRQRLSGMHLRGAGQNENLLDAWCSGDKEVWKLSTKYGEVTASSDHLFKTPEGSSRICDGVTHVMAMVSVGGGRVHEVIRYEGVEEWREVIEGLDVSSWGRVRSYYGQGAKSRREVSTLKKVTTNNAGRSVVSFNGKVHQVSRLVAVAFGVGADDAQILHKNDNPRDNRACNLYAGTPHDNMRDQYVNGGRRRLREVPVEVIDIHRAGREEVFDITVTGNHWFVANNLVVHNSYNEMSARYVPLPDENYLPSTARLTEGATAAQATSNRQANSEVQFDDEYFNGEWALNVQCKIDSVYTHQQEAYEALLAEGVPKELARVVLSVGRYSKMRAQANLRNWLGFLTLRQDVKAQYEIRVYADVLNSMLEDRFPRTLGLFNEEV